MYDKPDSQYSQLVMAATKAEMETPGGSVLEARAKSAVVDLEAQPKVASSDQSYEAITQHIAYLGRESAQHPGKVIISLSNWPIKI